jgi:hypothetical protein
MADNQETPFGGNFSIQDTMEMGMGNAELLNDLMSPDTASASPDDIKDISAEDAPAPTAAKSKAPKAEESTEEKEEPTKDITSFLYGNDDEKKEMLLQKQKLQMLQKNQKKEQNQKLVASQH